jgi:hypothetical protein
MIHYLYIAAIVLDVLALCLAPVVILFLRERRERNALDGWQDRSQRTSLYDVTFDPPKRALISPAIFPATQDERDALEEALPGYKFVDPVTKDVFAEAARKRAPQPQTLRDVVLDTETTFGR